MASNPQHPREAEDPDIVRLIEERLKTLDREPTRGDEALEELRKNLKHPAPR